MSECYVCLLSVEKQADTPCSHPEPLCETCFQKVNKCPMCRIPFNNDVPVGDFSFGGPWARESFENNMSMSRAARNGDIDTVRLMIEQGATNFNSTMVEAARNGHENIVRLIKDHHNQ